eukprot:c4980_g1_i1.p1 GENE.c4980_g1_i1~~c4980_g1_i1.p1  ORF type:complete len:768 (-),score=154.89 c4980_g1_i1:300-2603(-)
MVWTESEPPVIAYDNIYQGAFVAICGVLVLVLLARVVIVQGFATESTSIPRPREECTRQSQRRKLWPEHVWPFHSALLNPSTGDNTASKVKKRKPKKQLTPSTNTAAHNGIPHNSGHEHLHQQALTSKLKLLSSKASSGHECAKDDTNANYRARASSISSTSSGSSSASSSSSSGPSSLSCSHSSSSICSKASRPTTASPPPSLPPTPPHSANHVQLPDSFDLDVDLPPLEQPLTQNVQPQIETRVDLVTVVQSPQKHQKSDIQHKEMKALSQPKPAPKKVPKAKPTSKPESKPETKPEPKLEPKAEPQTEPKPQKSKPEPKVLTQPKPEPKQELKSKSKPEPVSQLKPTPKPETKQLKPKPKQQQESKTKPEEHLKSLQQAPSNTTRETASRNLATPPASATAASSAPPLSISSLTTALLCDDDSNVSLSPSPMFLLGPAHHHAAPSVTQSLLFPSPQVINGSEMIDHALPTQSAVGEMFSSSLVLVAPCESELLPSELLRDLDCPEAPDHLSPLPSPALAPMMCSLQVVAPASMSAVITPSSAATSLILQDSSQPVPAVPAIRPLKKSFCHFFKRGRCRYGSKCRFAHSLEETQHRTRNRHHLRFGFARDTNPEAPAAVSSYCKPDELVAVPVAGDSLPVTIAHVLEAAGVSHAIHLFQKEGIDMDALVLMPAHELAASFSFGAHPPLCVADCFRIASVVSQVKHRHASRTFPGIEAHQSAGEGTVLWGLAELGGIWGPLPGSVDHQPQSQAFARSLFAFQNPNI